MLHNQRINVKYDGDLRPFIIFEPDARGHHLIYSSSAI